MFFRRSLDSILSEFTKTIERLREFDQRTIAEFNDVVDQQTALRVRQEALLAESLRASAVIRNMEKLLGVSNG